MTTPNVPLHKAKFLVLEAMLIVLKEKFLELKEN